MPSTFSGRLVAAAMAVMEMEEVLEARMVSGLQISSSSLKMPFLLSRASLAASTARSQSLASASSRVKETDLLLQVLLQHALTPLNESVGDVADENGLASLSENLSDPHTHGAGAQHHNLIDSHRGVPPIL